LFVRFHTGKPSAEDFPQIVVQDIYTGLQQQPLPRAQ
jgi:hypothetical protein